MSNFYILFPHNKKAVTVSCAPAANQFSYFNLLGGNRSSGYMTEATDSITFEYDFDTDIEIDSLFVADASQILNPSFSDSPESFDLTVSGSADGITWTAYSAETELIPAEGTLSSDHIVKFSGASKRFWKITFSTEEDSKFKISKLFLGKAFSFNLDPDEIKFGTAGYKTLYSLDGNLIQNDVQRLPFISHYVFTGITDNQLSEFIAELDVNERAPAALFTTIDQPHFSGCSVVYGNIQNISAVKLYRNFNQLGMGFYERF